MSENLGFRPKPEEEELRLKERELQTLESRLIESELQLANLRAELGAFERVYLKTVGVYYADLDELEAQIAELSSQREPLNPKAKQTAREARTRANDSRTGASDVALKEARRFSASSSLKNLYREVARRIHPDLAANEADRLKRQKLMAQANQAYENADESKLRAILEEYESSPEAVSGQGPGADLVRVIRKIARVKRRLSEIDAEVEHAKASDLFELKKKVDEGTKQGRDVLKEVASAVRSRIDERRAQLAGMHERVKK